MSGELRQLNHMRTDAYHGTNLDSYLSIVQMGFRPSVGICGNAVYFDLGSRDSAVEKALEKAEAGGCSYATERQETMRHLYFHGR